MRLMLLRHAKSERAEPGQSDRDRCLNARGRGDAQALGTYLTRHGLVPDTVKVSAARRTRETWECLAAKLSAQPRLDIDGHLYNAVADAVLAAVQEMAASARVLLVIGHNPGLHELARRLIASGDADARERLDEQLPTCGLVVMDFPGEDWRKLHPYGGRLERFVAPRFLNGATE